MENEILKLARTLIEFQSVKNRPDELHRIVDFCYDFFVKDKNAHKYVIKKFESNGKPSLVVTFGQTKSPEILLIGHLDVVEAEKEMFEPKVEGNKLIGRGAIDMKSSTAIIMLIMRKIGEAEILPDIGLMLTTDEEVGGLDGVNYLFNKQGYSCKCAVVPDGGHNLKLTLKEKGVLHFKLKAVGKAVHGSQPWKGENAIDKLINVYQALKQEFPNPKNKNEWRTSLNLGKISGGDAVNKVADWAEMFFDLRFTESNSLEELKERIKKIISQFSGVNMEEIASGTCLNVPYDNLYVSKWQKSAKKVLGKEMKIESECGASDARFLAEKDISVIISEPVGGNHHGRNEYVDIESLEKYFQTLWDFVKDWSK